MSFCKDSDAKDSDSNPEDSDSGSDSSHQDSDSDSDGALRQKQTACNADAVSSLLNKCSTCMEQNFAGIQSVTSKFNVSL